MASVEVSKLTSQEVAELACTYAALILHDDDQGVTGTSFIMQAIRSTNSFKELALKSNPTGLKYLLRLLKAKISVHFSTSEDQLHHLLLPKLLQLLLKKHQRNKRKKRKLPHHPKNKKKIWIWVIYSDDSLPHLNINKSTIFKKSMLTDFFTKNNNLQTKSLSQSISQ